MGRRLTPGRKLVRELRSQLPPGMEFTQADEISLSLLESSADRLEVLRGHLAAELAKPEAGRRAVELASETRQLEVNIEKSVIRLAASMEPPPVKSWQHQKAANSRWHGA
jgi:hypothetical protein